MNLVGMGLARGTRVHLVEVGQARTLCDHPHGVNPRYTTPESIGTVPADSVTCPRCIAIKES